MQIKFLAYGGGPDGYTFSGEVVTAHYNGNSKDYDLSQFPEGGVFLGAEDIAGTPAIYFVERIDGELKVSLFDRTIASQYPNKKANWRESGWLDDVDYSPDKCYAIPAGMAGVEDYEIVRGVDVAGVEGWTVRKKEVAANG